MVVKNYLLFPVLIFSVLISCTTAGTYIDFSPAARAVFDYENFSTLAIVYAPDNEGGARLRNSLRLYFKIEQFKIIDDANVENELSSAGLFRGKISPKDAQKIGKLLEANAVVVVRKIDFTDDYRIRLAVVEIHDTWGGMLVEALYSGMENPDTPEDTAKSIVYRISFMNQQMKVRREKNRLRLFPRPE